MNRIFHSINGGSLEITLIVPLKAIKSTWTKAFGHILTRNSSKFLKSSNPVKKNNRIINPMVNCQHTSKVGHVSLVGDKCSNCVFKLTVDIILFDPPVIDVWFTTVPLTALIKETSMFLILNWYLSIRVSPQKSLKHFYKQDINLKRNRVKYFKLVELLLIIDSKFKPFGLQG